MVRFPIFGFLAVFIFDGAVSTSKPAIYPEDGCVRDSGVASALTENSAGRQVTEEPASVSRVDRKKVIEQLEPLGKQLEELVTKLGPFPFKKSWNNDDWGIASPDFIPWMNAIHQNLSPEEMALISSLRLDEIHEGFTLFSELSRTVVTYLYSRSQMDDNYIQGAAILRVAKTVQRWCPELMRDVEMESRRVTIVDRVSRVSEFASRERSHRLTKQDAMPFIRVPELDLDHIYFRQFLINLWNRMRVANIENGCEVRDLLDRITLALENQSCGGGFCHIDWKKMLELEEFLTARWEEFKRILSGPCHTEINALLPIYLEGYARVLTCIPFGPFRNRMQAASKDAVPRSKPEPSGGSLPSHKTESTGDASHIMPPPRATPQRRELPPMMVYDSESLLKKRQPTEMIEERPVPKQRGVSSRKQGDAYAIAKIDENLTIVLKILGANEEGMDNKALDNAVKGLESALGHVDDTESVSQRCIDTINRFVEVVEHLFVKWRGSDMKKAQLLTGRRVYKILDAVSSLLPEESRNRILTTFPNLIARFRPSTGKKSKKVKVDQQLPIVEDPERHSSTEQPTDNNQFRMVPDESDTEMDN